MEPSYAHIAMAKALFALSTAALRFRVYSALARSKAEESYERAL